MKIQMGKSKRLLLWAAIIGLGFALVSVIWYDSSELYHSSESSHSLLHIIAILIDLAIVMLSITITYLVQKHAAIHLKIAKEETQHEQRARKKAEETKQKLEEALFQGQKLQAIGTLASGIAHDFNNILYAIKGYVEMAREDVEKESLVYNNLGKVLEGTQRGQDLVARILAFGRRQQAATTAVPIQSIIESVLGLLRPTIPTSVTINLIGLSEECLVAANPTQIHQAIVNLIINAVDAMDGEGTISITLERILAKDDYLKQFSHLPIVNYCKIEISDTGHGMDQSTMKRIFEPFYTTKEVGKGTGLGLATVHTIIEQHQGEITVASQLGKGTIFTILLPEYPSTGTEREMTNG
jgi:signal transduction histidine kinase